MERRGKFWNSEVDKWQDIDKMEKYESKGIFPFLQLPGEVREQIYPLVFAQAGPHRHSNNYRGTISTNLLATCRQIHNEAGHLPLALNRLWFASPFAAFNFFGFQLQPHQARLVTSLRLDINGAEEAESSCLLLLLRQLGKLEITSMEVIMKGRINHTYFIDYDCFIPKFCPLKTLERFDLVIPSGLIHKNQKKRILHDARKVLLKQTSELSTVRKRKAKFGDDHFSKIVKLGSDNSDSSSEESVFSRHNSVAATESPSSSLSSPGRYQQLREQDYPLHDYVLAVHANMREFASSLGPLAAHVRIRLDQARKAIENDDEPRFNELEGSILSTLGEQFEATKIAFEQNQRSFPRLATQGKLKRRVSF
ncbi:hypothetical protein MMC09_003333 [Bachmanniomyces sp. S44760]|nr:hypothetical protein [Bachmanniomyces sp. S44760]